MPFARVGALTSLALIAFAGNSLLCRAALAHTGIDPASFTTVRLVSGAVTLWILATIHSGGISRSGSWLSALALFTYAAGFSFAYVSLTAAAGALIVFGAVQITMIGYGIWTGERMRMLQMMGILLACGGLVGLLLPGLSAPPLAGSLLMLAAGIAWGVYSLRGKGSGSPLKATAGNFARTVPVTVALSLLLLESATLNGAGIGYAVLSGAVASGMGYAIWYTALPSLKSTTAATVQLSVPVVAALGGVVFLGEQLTARLVIASLAILGGIALVVLVGNRPVKPRL